MTVRVGWVMMTGVRSCYDEGKRTAETLTMDYHRGAGVEVGYLITKIIIIPLNNSNVMCYMGCSNKLFME